jgi:hypothetical protein
MHLYDLEWPNVRPTDCLSVRPILFATNREEKNSIVQWSFNMGYAELKKYVLFRDEHRIIRARFRVSHTRPGHKDIRLGAQFFSLSYNFALLK